MILLRRVAISMVLSLLDPSSPVLVFCLLLVLLASLLAQAWLWPFRRTADNRAELISLTVLILVSASACCQ